MLPPPPPPPQAERSAAVTRARSRGPASPEIDVCSRCSSHPPWSSTRGAAPRVASSTPRPVALAPARITPGRRTWPCRRRPSLPLQLAGTMPTVTASHCPRKPSRSTPRDMIVVPAASGSTADPGMPVSSNFTMSADFRWQDLANIDAVLSVDGARLERRNTRNAGCGHGAERRRPPARRLIGLLAVVAFLAVTGAGRTTREFQYTKSWNWSLRLRDRQPSYPVACP